MRPQSSSPTALRAGAVAAILGTLAYLGMTVLHGDPPIDAPEKILEHVADRPWWRAAHLGNILAVLLYLGAFSTVIQALGERDARGLGRFAQATMICATAVFAVYFSIHGFGFSTLADRWVDVAAADRAALLTETNAVLTLLGSVAFTAQALLGLAILLYGLTLARSSFPGWLGWSGAVIGAGWLTGALLIDFAVIVPFTTLAWVWMIVLGGLLWTRGSRRAAVPAGV